MQGQVAVAGAVFPYGLADLKYWIIKRKDGSVIKFVLQEGTKSDPRLTAGEKSAESSAQLLLAHAWCHHFPVNPVYMEKGLSLYIADDVGVKKDGPNFDVVIDCGDVVKFTNGAFFEERVFAGDRTLVKKFDQFQLLSGKFPRVLKIQWWDRCAPDLTPAFWPALAEELKNAGRVVINCQGGHGRSGTGIVCLLMAYIPSYTPLDAFIHLRAVHCPRAIESKAQHDYINSVGLALGREGNMPSLGTVDNYKEAFEQSKNQDAQRLRKLLQKTS